MTRAILSEHRAIWYDKPVLRAIYSDYYRQIVAACAPGRSLEIGGGSGNLKEFASDVVSTDIVPSEWLDAAVDAHALPFADRSFANIVMVDVLHHLERPVRFFREAARVLQPGGRIIMLEPGITPVSWFFFKAFHPEPVVMNVDPLQDGALNPERAPFDANQAIPTVLFTRDRRRFEAIFPELRVERVTWLSLFAYPLSGGFRPWSLISPSRASALLRLEHRLEPSLGRWLGYRLLVVIHFLQARSVSPNHGSSVS